jgi:hypothetical protein
MQSHVGGRKAVTNPKVSCSAVRDAPICFGKVKASVEGIIERMVNECRGDAAVFVLWANGNSTDVQCVFERTSARVEWERQALGDALAVVLNNVVMDLVVLEGVSEFVRVRGVFGER